MKLIQSDMYKVQKAFEDGWKESSKTIINKACKWLIGEFSQEQDRDGHPNVESRSCVSVEELIQDFRKEMIISDKWRPRKYDYVKFSYGYTSRTMNFTYSDLAIAKGNPEWGAPNKDVFIIKLGNRIK